MEQHPIPQNVTSFEFHLVGDMTLKQFLYLGTGIGTAYLLYAATFYSHPIFALPLIIISSILGVSFAFLPIFDRPLDHWVKAFFEAVYSPTIGFWQVRNGPKQKLAPNDPFLKNRLQLYLASQGMNLNSWDNVPTPAIPRKISPALTPAKKAEEVQQININTIRKSDSGIPSSKELTDLVEMAGQAQILQAKIRDTEKLIKQMTSSTKSDELSQASANLQNLISQTEELYRKTSKMNQAITPVFQPQPKLQVQIPPLATANPKVTAITAAPHKETVLVLTSTPNVINGVVSDSTENYAADVIVIIHNKEGIPVRALKTNKLGQFVGSTPLPSGVYTLTLEKEGFIFETLQITLDGSALTPIKIIAKKGGL